MEFMQAVMLACSLHALAELDQHLVDGVDADQPHVRHTGLDGDHRAGNGIGRPSRMCCENAGSRSAEWARSLDAGGKRVPAK